MNNLPILLIDFLKNVLIFAVLKCKLTCKCFLCLSAKIKRIQKNETFDFCLHSSFYLFLNAQNILLQT